MFIAVKKRRVFSAAASVELPVLMSTIDCVSNTFGFYREKAADSFPHTCSFVA